MTKQGKRSKRHPVRSRREWMVCNHQRTKRNVVHVVISNHFQAPGVATEENLLADSAGGKEWGFSGDTPEKP